MNQDEVKTKLHQLRPEMVDFAVIFSGKASKRANGLYHPETKEIIINNKNFEDDNSLMYTAIHEFAHHVHYGTCKVTSSRAHTKEFRAIFHQLLSDAEKAGIYTDTIESTPELAELVADMQERFVVKNAELMKQFGEALMEAEKTCRKHNARFEDFVERALSLSTHAAQTLMVIKALDLPAELGIDNMKTLAAIKNSEARQVATESLLAGETPDQVKAKTTPPKKIRDPKAELYSERKRCIKTIDKLNTRIVEIDEQLEFDYGIINPDEAQLFAAAEKILVTPKEKRNWSVMGYDPRTNREWTENFIQCSEAEALKLAEDLNTKEQTKLDEVAWKRYTAKQAKTT